MVAPNAATIFRDYVTDGIPGTGRHDPIKSEIREWGAIIDALADALIAVGADAPAVCLYDTRADAAAATIPDSVEHVIVLRYAAGVNVKASYEKVVSLTSSDAGFQSADGAYWQISEKIIRPEMISSAATTAAIHTAIKVANETGAGEVRLGSRTYLADEVSGQTYCFRLYGPVNLIGDASHEVAGAGAHTGTVIRYNASVSNSSTVMLWNCGSTAGVNIYHGRVEGIAFMPDGFTPNNPATYTGAYAATCMEVHAGSDTQAFSNCTISNCIFGPTLERGLYFSKVAGGGDWTCGVVEKCFFFGNGGITANAWLDNCTIQNNSFSINGPNPALDIAQVAGAGNLLITHNHGLLKVPGMYLRIGYGSRIIRNYFEVVAPVFGGALGLQYLYYLHGTSGEIFEGEFKHNICVRLLGQTSGMIGLVYVDNTLRMDFEGNLLRNDEASAIVGFYFSDDNLNPRIGENKIQGNITPTAGSRPGYTFTTLATVKPIDYDVPLTLGSNGWVAATETPVVRVTREGIAIMTGGITTGTTTTGTKVATVPAGYRPLVNTVRAVVINTGATVGIQIATNGDITLLGAGDATYTGLSCTYPVQSSF